MFAELGDGHVGVSAERRGEGDDLPADRRHAARHFHFTTVAHQRGVGTFGGRLDDRHHGFSVWLGADDGGAVGLDDARFLLGDLLDGVAQPFHMVHIDRPDNGGIGIEHIGGVPRSAHADLDHGHIHRRVGELPNRHRGEHLEETHARLARFPHLGIHQGDQILDLIPRVDEIVVGKLLPVDGDALVDLFQMRRSVQPRAQSVGAANRLGHARGGTLAVGAGHMDDAKRFLGVAQQVEHEVHPVKIEVGGVMLRWTAHNVQFHVTDGLTVPVRMLE